MPRLLVTLVWSVPLLTLSGCFQTRYLVQATGGQVDIIFRARPIDAALRRDDVPQRVKRVLFWVPKMKAWGQAQGLQPSGSYERYADLHRDAAVWVVQGSAPLAFEAREWCFPIVGSVPYLGYFDEAAAHAFADKLAREEGLDVDVRGASAYSTLGWLRDPVLSTMISEGPEAVGDLANVILHESVHATIYIAGQSSFDESLASFVADRMTVEWLEQTWGADSVQTTAWKRALADYESRTAKMHEAWNELDALYRSDRNDDGKRAEKMRILDQLKKELGTRETINNATLVDVKTYGRGKVGFERLFEACGRRWPAFLGAVRSLKASDFPETQTEDIDPVLENLAAQGCSRRSGI